MESAGVDALWVDRWMRLTAERLSDERAHLGALDREIGDGDHGENMDRGFAAVITAFDREPPATVSAGLTSAAMALLSSVGGAAGPLYGTAFLRAAAAAGTQTELDSAGVVAILASARDGIAARGKAEPGEKTMVDAWHPAVQAAEQAAGSGAAIDDVLAAAAAAARAGAAATEPLIARKGRASYLGDRAIGHRDPGAESTAILLTAAAEAVGRG